MVAVGAAFFAAAFRISLGLIHRVFYDATQVVEAFQQLTPWMRLVVVALGAFVAGLIARLSRPHPRGGWHGGRIRRRVQHAVRRLPVRAGNNRRHGCDGGAAAHDGCYADRHRNQRAIVGGGPIYGQRSFVASSPVELALFARGRCGRGICVQVLARRGVTVGGRASASTTHTRDPRGPVRWCHRDVGA